MRGPWTFALFAIGIILWSDDYFPGDELVGALAVLAGICRFGVQLLATAALAKMNSMKPEELNRVVAKAGPNQWMPPKAPR